ncbi:MAG: quinone oxidoreductase [SAR324 cluster bacterium]|nr:quinone oxidoreductase [SAR324 cluster bacterium]
MPKAIRIHETGGPEKLKYDDVVVPDPAEEEVCLTHHAIGLNYIDVYHRTGLYPLPALPAVIGLEAAGVVTAIGKGVTEFKEGDRVAYAGTPPGSYAEKRLIPAHRLVLLPDSIDFETGAAMMLQGMTAQYLLHRTYQVKKGDLILCHAAAGGVGLILCQWAKAIGAVVIGTVGSPEKAELAKANGCEHVINYRQENFTEKVKEISNGKGVAVVYDSIGQATFEGSLNCLQPMGMMVTYGNASGPVAPMDPGILGKMGSLFLTRPSLMNYTAKREDLLASANSLIEAILSSKVSISINQRYPLKEAAQAHRDLEARKTTGSTILLP